MHIKSLSCGAGLVDLESHYHRDRVSNTTAFHSCSITDLVVNIIDHMVEEYSPSTYKE